MKKNEKFPIILRALRKEKNMTQTELAERLGVSRSKIANWEAGIRFPQRDDIEYMVRLFGVSADYLYGKSDRRYNIDTGDYFELDLTKLNSRGMVKLYEYYRLLLLAEEYRNNTKNA